MMTFFSKGGIVMDTVPAVEDSEEYSKQQRFFQACVHASADLLA